MTLLVMPLASSSEGNALLLRCGGTALLVDYGLSLRVLEPLLSHAGLQPGMLAGVLLTHEHGDHAQGAGVLARRYQVPVICNSATRAALDSQLRQAPVQELPAGERASLGPFDVCSFAVSHDAAAPVGYCLSAAGATVGLAVDLGCWNDELVAHLRRADLLLVEANHQRERLLSSAYPWSVCQRIAGPRGHLDNRQAGELLAAVGADGRWRDARLAHLSVQANRPAHALRSVKEVLRGAGITSMGLGVLPRRATRTRKGLPVWSSDRLFRQLDMFG